MSSIPRDSSPDSTLALLSEGYTFISNRCRRYGSDLFETRLMLRKAVCMMGEEAAQVFYEPDRFTRTGAMPPTTLMLLQDKGSVQMLDGDAHRRRKEMFMSVMTPVRARQLAAASAAQWEAHLPLWENRDTVVLHDAARHLLCHTVCTWAGIPLTEPEAARRTRELGAMIDGAGAIGPRNWHAQRLRARTERWGQEIIEQIRSGTIEVPDGSAAHVIATHRDANGDLLGTEVAAVELINVLRPTVAVARFITFAALALHDHPACREKLREDEAYVELFVQEVRRFYPFFPLIGGRAREAFEWKGCRFTPGTWVLLDLYLGRPGHFPAGAVSVLGRKCLQPHPPGRRRPLRGPPLRRGMDHHRADENRRALSDGVDAVRRPRARSADRPIEHAGPSEKPVHHQQCAANSAFVMRD